MACCWATSVAMRPESSIVKLGGIASGVAIAVYPLTRSLIHVAAQISDRSRRPICLLHASRARDCCWKPGSHGLRGQTQLGVHSIEELLSELIARERMLRPHLGSRLVSTPLTFGVHSCTLSGEERCGRMIANPVKSTCTSTAPQLSERVDADACL